MQSDAGARLSEILTVLASGRLLAQRAAVLVAHPDDEVLGLSASLPLLSRLTLIHATDGAAPAEGVPADIAGIRFGELEAALAALGCRPERKVRCDFADGQLAARVGDLAARLVGELADREVVITHAFEGGHPDHDACAVAVQHACALIEARGGRAPVRLEFAVYALFDGQVGLNTFPPSPGPAPVTIRLSEEQRVRKAAALAAFESQAHVVSRFPLDGEVLRVAPLHDAAAPRDPGTLLFARAEPGREARWRMHVGSALASG